MTVKTESKVAIVTGASSGIGLALSHSLLSSNWTVIQADLSSPPPLPSSIAANLPSNPSHPRNLYIKTNVSCYTSQLNLFRTVWKTYGRIDALCANAGIVDKGSIYQLSNSDEINDDPSETDIPEPDLTCTDVVFKGVVYGTYLATHFMKHNENPAFGPKGSIIATASIAAIQPHPTYPEYDGAKAGVVNFIRATGPILYAHHNILLGCVLPGIVHTAIVPDTMVAAVKQQFLTPLSTIVRGYWRYLAPDETDKWTVSDTNVDAVGRDDVPGGVLEASVEKLVWIPASPMGNGEASKRAVTVWEPLFEQYHGCKSGLEDAIA